MASAKPFAVQFLCKHITPLCCRLAQAVLAREEPEETFLKSGKSCIVLKHFHPLHKVQFTPINLLKVCCSA